MGKIILSIVCTLCLFIGGCNTFEPQPLEQYAAQGEGYSAVSIVYQKKINSIPAVKDEFVVQLQNKPKCCDHCICEDDCNCAYPGECLVNRHNGWPVTICDGDVCIKYWPRGEDGKPYNPYSKWSKQEQAKHPELKDGIFLDKDLNEISNKKTISNGGGGRIRSFCRSCG